MKLTPVQRIRLLELLPERGDILTLKILRKLRESLSFSEAEMRQVQVRQGYACRFEERDEKGHVTRCKAQGFFSGPSRCGDHNIPMVQDGRLDMVFDAAFGAAEKEVVMGAQAFALTVAAVKGMEGRMDLAAEHLALYEKFVPALVEQEA